VSWIAPDNGGQPITGYTITGNPSGHAVVSGGVTTAVVYGLTNGITYTFTVQATNVIGTSPPSPPSNAVTPLARLTTQSSPGVPPARQPVSPSTPNPGPGPRLPARGPLPGVTSRGATASPPDSLPAIFEPRVYYLR